jgi:hypothetical protein
VKALRVALLGAVLFLPARASAFNLEEWVPGLKLAPFVSQRTEYESNVFQVPSHAQDDFILKTTPGLYGEYVAGPLSLSGGYRAEILRFLTLPSQDAVHHFMVGQGRFESSRLLLNIRDDYTLTSDPPNSELTGRIESTTNVAAPEVEYRLTDRFSLGADYSFTRVTFPAILELDRSEHLGGGSVFWKFLPKTDLKFTYRYGNKAFDTATNRDVTRNVALLGLRGDLTSKLSSTFRLGYEDREPTRGRSPAYRGLVAGGDWIYKPTDRTTISLLTDRSVQESVFADALFFVSTVATVTAEHRVVPKLLASVRVTGGDNSYPTKATLGTRTKFRDDTILGAGVRIEYDIQPWMRVGVDYSTTRRVSNFREFNFTDDRVAGTITFQF